MKIFCANPREQFEEYKLQIEEIIKSTLESGVYINGTHVKGLEREFADYNNSRFSLGVSSGTSALEMVLRSQNFSPDDEIITVSHTAIPTVSAIKLANLKPVLIDIDENSYTMCPEKLIKAITPKTKAVIAVHLYGQPANLDRIQDICNKYNLILIEDCSQAHGAQWKNKKVGNFGIAGCFSCYPTKNLGAIGDAGLISVNDQQLYDKLKSMREYGWNSNRISIDDGGNYRLDELQAAILRVKLKNLDDMNRKRQKIAEFYDKNLPVQLKRPHVNENASHVYHLYVTTAVGRDKLIEYMNKNGIFPGIHYPLPVHKHPGFQDVFTHSMDITEKISSNIISLPMYPELEKENLEYISNILQKYYS